jgi:hypothetical protein
LRASRSCMSDTFNGYHVWLGIPPNEQPPNHYRLLGIAAFETDLDVIDHAADRQMAHVRTFQSGKHGALSQQILNELALARLCLLNSEKKGEYDEQLRGRLRAATVTPLQVAPMPAAPMQAVPMPAVPMPAAPMPAAPIPVAKALPMAKPVSPRPAAVGGPQAIRPMAPTPVARVEAPRVVIPKIEDDAPLDFESSMNSLGAPSVQIRVKRRRYKRDNSWQSAAIVGTLAGVVVIVGIALFYLLRGLDWNQVLQGSFVTQPTSESTAPSTAPTTAPPVSPPAPPGQN